MKLSIVLVWPQKCLREQFGENRIFRSHYQAIQAIAGDVNYPQTEIPAS